MRSSQGLCRLLSQNNLRASYVRLLVNTIVYWIRFWIYQIFFEAGLRENLPETFIDVILYIYIYISLSNISHPFPWLCLQICST